MISFIQPNIPYQPLSGSGLLLAQRCFLLRIFLERMFLEKIIKAV
jgi:hypothetical protein